jgi:hypothetical protein
MIKYTMHEGKHPIYAQFKNTQSRTKLIQMVMGSLVKSRKKVWFDIVNATLYSTSKKQKVLTQYIFKKKLI